MPSAIPSVNRDPTSTPSAAPTLRLSDGTFLTKEITTGGNYNGTASKRIVFVIDPPPSSSSAVHVVITGNDHGRSIFKVLPRTNLTLTITNFHNNQDLIDLTAFSGSVSGFQDLSYRSDPLVLLLPKEQTIVLSSHASFDLSESNFLFSSTSNTNQNQNDNSNGAGSISAFIDHADKQLIVMGSILLGLLFLTFIGSQFCEVSSMEKFKLKKLLEQKIRQDESTDHQPLTAPQGPPGVSPIADSDEDNSSTSETGSDTENNVIDLTVSLKQHSKMEGKDRHHQLSAVPEASSIGSSSIGSSTLGWSYDSISEDEEYDDQHEPLRPNDENNQTTYVDYDGGEVRDDSSLSWNTLSSSSHNSLS
jgi:hypothetical protein